MDVHYHLPCFFKHTRPGARAWSLDSLDALEGVETLDEATREQLQRWLSSDFSDAEETEAEE